MTKDTTPDPIPETDILKRLKARLDRLEERHEQDQRLIGLLTKQLDNAEQQAEPPRRRQQREIDAWSDRQAALKRAADDQLEAGEHKFKVGLYDPKTGEIVCGERIVGTDHTGYVGEQSAIAKYRDFYGILKVTGDFNVIPVTGDLEEARSYCFPSTYQQKKAAAQRAAQPA